MKAKDIVQSVYEPKGLETCSAALEEGVIAGSESPQSHAFPRGQERTGRVDPQGSCDTVYGPGFAFGLVVRVMIPLRGPRGRGSEACRHVPSAHNYVQFTVCRGR